MSEIPPVPGPEPEWRSAVSAAIPELRHVNPVRQHGIWWGVASMFEEVLALECDIGLIASRLVLTLETSWDSLADVKLALFEWRGNLYVVSQRSGGNISAISIRGNVGLDFEEVVEELISLIQPQAEIIVWRAESGGDKSL
ncbi:hypothetical protein ACIRL2_32795 [Embleya sp. NPDC127516]|uniref:hypothetical protein n=1 Tax=Embleya sp. NPDC127516 TaxID=3363990 RepID=UPI003828278A